MTSRRTADPLQTLPGVGPAMARDLRDLGFLTPADLIDQDPQAMFQRLEALRGRQDRCVLYVFRCAVYAAGGGAEPDRLKWWNWSDSAVQAPRSGPSRRRSRAARRS